MIPTKEDIQARYLRGEINYDAYMKLLGRLDQERRRNAEEEQKQREAARLDGMRMKYLSSDKYKNNAPSPSLFGSKK